jgi:hypothetical protein
MSKCKPESRSRQQDQLDLTSFSLVELNDAKISAFIVGKLINALFFPKLSA